MEATPKRTCAAADRIDSSSDEEGARIDFGGLDEFPSEEEKGDEHPDAKRLGDTPRPCIVKPGAKKKTLLDGKKKQAKKSKKKILKKKV